MRNLKRALSLTLASVMLLGMMVVGAGAASFPDVDDNDNIEAIEVLKALDVMVGDENGNFNPDTVVTRAEMAVVITKLLGLNPGGTSSFSDVPDWAQPYVAVVEANGIVAGYGNGKFGSDDPVTAVQAALMLMKTLGYFEYAGEVSNEDNWVVAVTKQATKIQLFDSMSVSVNDPLTRDNVAKLTLNTLESDVIIVEEHGGLSVDGNGISVSQKPSYTYTKVSAEKTSDYRTKTANQDEVQQLVEKLFGNKLKKDDNDGVETAYGMPGYKWTYPNSSTVIGTFAAKQPLYTWTTGIEDLTDNDVYKTLNLSGATADLDVCENGADAGADITITKGGSTKQLGNYKGATIYAVDTDDDGVADRLCVKYPYLAKVTKVTDATSSADRKITLEVWNKGTYGSTTGVTYETEEFEKDDYVLVYIDDTIANTAGNASTLTNHIIEIEPADSVTGKITAVSGNNGSAVSALTIDEKYTVGGTKLATKGLLDTKVVATDTYSFTSETTLYLSNGYILGAEGANGAKDISNIVYVTHAAYQPVGEYGATDYYVQVIRLDGTVENLKAGAGNPSVSAGFYTISESSGVYTFTPATDTTSTDIDNSTVYYGKNQIDDASLTLKEDTKTVTIDAVNTSGAVSAYLTANTRILYVKDSLGDLKTSMVLGPVRQVVDDDSVVLLSKDGSNYVVEAIIINGEQTSASDEVVYVNNTPKETLAGSAKTYEYYDITTGEKFTAPVKDSNTPAGGFATYSVDDEGYYRFTAVASGAGTANKDGSHPITQAITLYSTWLTEGSELKNADAAGATIINNTGNKDNDGLSLKDIADADALTGVVYVVDEKVVAIVINTYTETVLSNNAGLTGLTGVFTDADGDDCTLTDIDVTLTYTAGEAAGTINVAIGKITGTLANGDTITVTGTAASGELDDTDDDMVITYNNGAWASTETIKVTAANGTTVATHSFGSVKSKVAELDTDPVDGVGGNTNSGTYTSGQYGSAVASATTVSGTTTYKVTITKPNGGSPAADDTFTYTMVNSYKNAITADITIKYEGGNWVISDPAESDGKYSLTVTAETDARDDDLVYEIVLQ